MAGNSPTLVMRFFTDYSEAKARYNIEDIDIQNMDETGYAMGFAYGAKVVILCGNMSNFKTINGLKEWVSQIDAISMHGQTILLFIIFKGRQYIDLLQQEAIRAVGECSIGMTENGQLNQEVGMEWLRYFERYT